MNREFIYFKSFDEHWDDLGLTDDDKIELENELMKNPKKGKVIQHTGGVRKLRFKLPNKGKSGGARVLYADFVVYEKTAMLRVYGKGEKDDITESEKADLKKEVQIFENNLKKGI